MLYLENGQTVRYMIKEPAACSIRARDVRRGEDENYGGVVNGTPHQITFAFGWKRRDQDAQTRKAEQGQVETAAGGHVPAA